MNVDDTTPVPGRPHGHDRPNLRCHDGVGRHAQNLAGEVADRVPGPVVAQRLVEEFTDHIRYTDPLAGPVEILMADYRVPMILDEQGRNLRGTQAATVLTGAHHLSGAERQAAEATLTPEDQALLTSAAQRLPDRLSTLEHAVRVLRAAGVTTEITDCTTDTMAPQLVVGSPSAWAVMVQFTGADSVDLLCGGAVRTLHAGPSDVVAPEQVRRALEGIAHERSYRSNHDRFIASIFDPSSIGLIRRRHGDQPEQQLISAHFAGVSGSTYSLELYRTSDGWDLPVLAYSGWVRVPVPVRRRQAAEQIARRNSEATPEMVVRALAAGHSRYEDYLQADPYGFGASC